MSLARWLRSNSEHYLLADAQSRAAARHGLTGPSSPRTTRELFWRKGFVPVYRLLPWKIRHFTIGIMPGSHRQEWSPPPVRHDPAI